jgi:hypothetical protein
MEYYLAVRMRRFGRPMPSGGGSATTSSSDDRPAERQMSHANGGPAVGAGVGGSTINRLPSNRPAGRTSSRPGRY